MKLVREKHRNIGSALTILAMVGLVSYAGMYLYKNMVYVDEQSVGEASLNEGQEHVGEGVGVTPGPATATSSQTAIDLDASIINDIDEELLNFEDLESLDFTF